MTADAERITRLVAELQGGRNLEENFRSLFEIYYRSIYRFFEKRGFHVEDCHDLTEETFIRVYKGMQTFRHDAQFNTWLFQIAANTYRKALRERSALKRTAAEVAIQPSDEIQGIPPNQSSQVHPSSVPDPLDEILEQERRRILREAIYELPNQMRRCVVLRVYQELSYQEIAIVLRISVETAKAHLFQAKQRLKDALAGCFGEIDV